MLSRWQFTNVARVLASSGVIAYPTESVYGLGCDPYQLQAIRQILAIKNRPEHKGLILLVSDISQALPFIQPLNDKQLEIVHKARTRATTFLMPKRRYVSSLLSGEFNSLAIRLTTHPIVRQICDLTQKPLVSTSCNMTGKSAMTQVTQVRNRMINRVDMIVGGQCGGQKPSQIIDIITGRVIRH